MIVGRGSLAKMLNDREGAIFFASGVGNSQSNNPEEFQKEAMNLQSWAYTQHAYKSLFYFSTISISTVNTPYTAHKLLMEKTVKKHFSNYNIIRLGNIWECTNPHTFRNYLKAHQEAEIRDEWKYMIHQDQLLMLTNNLPLVGRNEISVFGEMLKVKDCL